MKWIVKDRDMYLMELTLEVSRRNGFRLQVFPEDTADRNEAVRFDSRKVAQLVAHALREHEADEGAQWRVVRLVPRP